jgi:hypothetical protein
MVVWYSVQSFWYIFSRFGMFEPRKIWQTSSPSQKCEKKRTWTNQPRARLLMPLPDSAADGDGVLLWLGPGLGLVPTGVMSVVWKKHDFCNRINNWILQYYETFSQQLYFRKIILQLGYYITFIVFKNVGSKKQYKSIK